IQKRPTLRRTVFYQRKVFRRKYYRTKRPHQGRGRLFSNAVKGSGPPSILDLYFCLLLPAASRKRKGKAGTSCFFSQTHQICIPGTTKGMSASKKPNRF